MARVWIRVALIKISSRGLLLRVGVGSLLRAGADDLAICEKLVEKVREKIPCSRLQYCEIYGLGVAAQLVTQRLGQHACRTNLEYGECHAIFRNPPRVRIRNITHLGRRNIFHFEPIPLP
jgi:hypothetical protein